MVGYGLSLQPLNVRYISEGAPLMHTNLQIDHEYSGFGECDKSTVTSVGLYLSETKPLSQGYRYQEVHCVLKRLPNS